MSPEDGTLHAGRDDRGPSPRRPPPGGPPARSSSSAPGDGDPDGGALTICLTGDVMTGRGVDQVLPHSVDPTLHERFVSDAGRYVELAEDESGPIPETADFGYPWGDALDALEGMSPQATVVNLETAVTTHDEPWPGKGIHYRMHPGNVPVLTTAGVDVCVLANNHVLDWGREGLSETLASLEEAGLATAGAGRDRGEACAPAPVEVERARGRVLVFALGSTTAGLPRSWAAGDDGGGVCLLPDLTEDSLREVARQVRGERGDGDVVVASLHWGSNWGYRVPERQRRFARRLVETAGVDVVHGHSSHHPRGLEIHRGRPILYGCGDFLNDYEGISGHERYRPELVLLYRIALEPGSRRLARMEAIPFRVRRFRLERAGEEEAAWLAETLDRESRKLGARVDLSDGKRLEIRAGR